MAATPSPRLVLVTYTVTVFLSALLLFGVQPMFTRMVLPQLGGAPSVWSVAMVFFQSTLLAGYAYAHWLGTIRNRIVPVIVHVAVLLTASLALPLGIAKGWGEPPASGTEFWLLGLFTISIGLPFFALAANNPLLQTWFVGTGHRDGKDPYFLYAASNIGSFLALLSYPVLLEPAFSLATQVQMWGAGFGLLFVLIAGCGALLLRSPKARSQRRTRIPAKPSWLTIGRWVFIAAVPSGLLIAVTAYISTDVAAMPLMWVIPLSLYLLTWVLVFARRPIFSQPFLLMLQPIAIAALIALILYKGRVPLIPNLSAHLLVFFIVAMACHGELARSRPHPTHLTTFYVALSLGGMIGGLFAGLFAPFAFSWVAEYPILAVLAVLCRPVITARWRMIEGWMPPAVKEYWPTAVRWFWPATALVALCLMVPAFAGVSVADTLKSELNAIVLTLAAISILLLRAPMKSAVAVALALALIRLYAAEDGHSETLRSFFGVKQLYEAKNGQFRILEHGTTIHGAERIRNEDGTPIVGMPTPITYYHVKSAMAQTIDAVRVRKNGDIKVAVIGLGAGTLACYREGGDSWRYFEIDPTMIAIARDPKRFTFISECGPNIPIVLGDARLTLAKEPDATYDIIIVDAYSSDAVPIHLATREAMAIYKSKLAPHGIVVMHISNRHLELQSVVVGIAAANGLKSWVWSDENEEEDDDNYVFSSDVVISAMAPEDLGQLSEAKTWVLTPPNPDLRTWTDDYSNIAGAFWRKLRR